MYCAVPSSLSPICSPGSSLLFFEGALQDGGSGVVSISGCEVGTAHVLDELVCLSLSGDTLLVFSVILVG